MTAAGAIPDELIQRVRSALAARDLGVLESHLADDVRWGSCVGRPEVMDRLGAALSAGADETADETADVPADGPAEVQALGDRLVVALEPATRHREGDPRPAPGRPPPVAVLFVRAGRIVEIQTHAEWKEALAAERSASPEPPDTPARLSRLAAVLPVRDLDAALRHYGRLGFAVSEYEGGGYGYAERDGLSLHLAAVRDLDPATTTSAVYLYVDDADALFAEWLSAGVSGQFFEPRDTPYGLREGAHVDRDGNLLRFGSPLSDPTRSDVP